MTRPYYAMTKSKLKYPDDFFDKVDAGTLKRRESKLRICRSCGCVGDISTSYSGCFCIDCVSKGEDYVGNQ